MAAGGTWQSQNKVRPGAYINFVGTPKALSSVGERGVVAAPLSLSWGAQIIEMTANDLVTGASLEKAGVLFTDAEALNLRLLLQSCARAVIYRLNAETAVKAAKTVAGLTVTAKHGGAFGNRIRFTVQAPEAEEPESGGGEGGGGEGGGGEQTPGFTPSNGGDGTRAMRSGDGEATEPIIVKTYVDGSLKDTQKVATLADLVANDYAEFEAAEGTLVSIETPTALEGGSDGEEVTDISAALAALESYKFNILAISQTASATKAQAVQWIESLRNDKGVKVQCVVCEYAGDSEAVISTWQGYRLEDGTEVSMAQAVLAVAGMEAGAAITQSLSGAVVPGAVAVIDPPQTHDEIVDALNAGKLVLSRRGDGSIVIEKDQNTLHTFTPKHGYVFSKNRPIRVIDQIGNDVRDLWNNTYLGKVSNDEDGRSIFKNDLVSYFKTLEKIGAIQNFRADDLIVLPGNDTDAVVVKMYVQPVDSMEKLYMKVNVEG